MQNFLNTLWEFTEGKEGKHNLIQKAFKVCKVFKVKSLKPPNLMFHQKRQHPICFVKTFKKRKKICRVFLSVRQVLSYRTNGKKLRPVIRFDFVIVFLVLLVFLYSGRLIYLCTTAFVHQNK